MVMSLPKLRARVVDRIKLPDLPDRTELAQRVRMPDLSEIDLSGLPRRLPWRRPRAQDRAFGGASVARAGLGLLALALAGIAGAVAAYFFDPDRGRGRRIETANRLAGLGRRATRRVGRLARYTTSTATSLGGRMSRRRSDYEPPNDATLAAKVESELFRDPSIDKGRLSVNVENGTVILRGTADSPGQIEQIVAATRGIKGVSSVRSLLHPAGQPPLGEMASPNGTADELVPANPGL
jgi:hypothetical protein